MDTGSKNKFSRGFEVLRYQTTPCKQRYVKILKCKIGRVVYCPHHFFVLLILSFLAPENLHLPHARICLNCFVQF